MRALVLGANGYVGRHLRLQLIEAGISHTLGDIQREHSEGDSAYVQLDLLDKESFSHLIENHDVIYCLSGKTGTYDGFKNYESFVETNELALLNLLDVTAKLNPSAKIVFPSTRLVYKGIKDAELAEDSRMEAKTIYAVNKIACEKYLECYANSFDLRYLVLRICVPYGNAFGGDYSYGTLGMMFNQASKGTIRLFGDGSQRRTLTHIVDISRIFVQAGLDNELAGDVFNIGGPDNLSIREIAEAIAKIRGANIENHPWPDHHKKIESGDTVFNGSKLESRINVSFHHDFYSWLKSRS